MKLIYHLCEYLPGRYQVTANMYGVSGQPENTYKLSITCDCSKCLNIDQIDSKVKCGIRSRMYMDNKKDPRIPSATGLTVVWDEDRTDMKTFAIKKPQETDASDCVYEVCQVSGVWTICKHDAPLLTYDEATKVLFKQIIAKRNTNE